MQNWKPMQIDRQIFKRKSNKLTVNLFRDVLSRYAKIIFHLKMSNFNHNFNENGNFNRYNYSCFHVVCCVLFFPSVFVLVFFLLSACIIASNASYYTPVICMLFYALSENCDDSTFSSDNYISLSEKKELWRIENIVGLNVHMYVSRERGLFYLICLLAEFSTF